MPDSGITDGTTFTSSFWDTYARQQVVTQCTSGARPTGVEGRIITETDTDRIRCYTGSTWQLIGWYSTAGRPGVILTDAAQSIGNATLTDITWGTEVSDVDGWTSGGSATLTVPTGWGGQYMVTYSGLWAVAPGATNGASCLLNGTATYGTSDGTLLGVSTLSFVRALVAGDTLKFQVYQSSVGAINVVSRLDIVWLGP